MGDTHDPPRACLQVLVKVSPEGISKGSGVATTEVATMPIVRQNREAMNKRVAVLAAAILIACVSSAARCAGRSSFEHRLRDATACGPAAIYVVTLWLGRDCSLREITELLGGKERKKHSLAELYQGLRAIDIASHLRLVTPRQLRTCLQKQSHVLILPVRREGSSGIDHCVVAVNYAGGHVHVIDYPNYNMAWSLDSLTDRWDGQAIVLPVADGPGGLLQAASEICYDHKGALEAIRNTAAAVLLLAAVALGLWRVVSLRRRREVRGS